MLALSACAGSTPTLTPDAATPRPTASPTPSAEPVDPLTTVTVLVARPDALELRDATGTVVATLGYLSAPSEAVAALTTVFGVAPVDQPVEGGNHLPPRTWHPDVGAGWEELVAIPELRQNPSGCSEPYLEYVEESRAAVGGPGTVKISVEFRPSEDSATIASVDAPVPVYENGCA
ncbi:hypothetical protein [Agromyces sp. NPDC057865]|uniref:hypothetical protein n=1 Tax=Agromyces sp. NPDC057865 TaxID=3346267 RepID=UPI00366F258E